MSHPKSTCPVRPTALETLSEVSPHPDRPLGVWVRGSFPTTGPRTPVCGADEPDRPHGLLPSEPDVGSSEVNQRETETRRESVLEPRGV